MRPCCNQKGNSMKKNLLLFVTLFLLSGCFLRPHKSDIEQGNIITQSQVDALHQGMSEARVKDIMGTPILVTLFSNSRLEYIYTFKSGYGEAKLKRVVCMFQYGKLQKIEVMI